MKKIWIHKANSFKEAEDFDKRYYSNMDSTKRLEMAQFLREKRFKIKGWPKDVMGRRRLERVIRVRTIETEKH